MSPLHERRRYEVRHLTEYSYEDDVTMSFERAMLRPRTTPQQEVLEHAVEILPEPDLLEESVDAFDNFTHYVEISTPHQLLAVHKRSVLQVQWPAVDLAALDSWTVDSAARSLATDPAVCAFDRVAYTLPSRLVTLGAAEKAFAAGLLPQTLPLGQAIERVIGEIYDAFDYKKGVTSVATTLPEVIAARAGVCQDFAHLAAAAFRVVGLPARYVSGYIETSPPPGREKLEGSDATHAWVSVMVPGGHWVDLDPTNNHLADSRYLVTAWGRDFRDVSPLKGIIVTDGKRSSLRVAVTVTRLED